ncbi:ATP-binding protein [Owenweeksia hongkongensis]|uniref:ATP-binding protein n=1 Tax=Owenweeksia hongkongensis TaxID=253245 RepID=UPI003A94A84A
MKKKIIFIGGIHGVGKGTVCNLLCDRFKLEHFSASELLKWSEISSKTNKKVQNIDQTQTRLLNGIERHITDNRLSILDGHLCLLNNFGVPEKVAEEVMIKISPQLIGVVTENLQVVKDRLEARDGVEYEISSLEEMQALEIAQGKKLANLLDINFVEIIGGDIINISQRIEALI